MCCTWAVPTPGPSQGEPFDGHTDPPGVSREALRRAVWAAAASAAGDGRGGISGDGSDGEHWVLCVCGVGGVEVETDVKRVFVGERWRGGGGS